MSLNKFVLSKFIPYWLISLWVINDKMLKKQIKNNKRDGFTNKYDGVEQFFFLFSLWFANQVHICAMFFLFIYHSGNKD